MKFKLVVILAALFCFSGITLADDNYAADIDDSISLLDEILMLSAADIQSTDVDEADTTIADLDDEIDLLSDLDLEIITDMAQDTTATATK